ncbi:unnamed protein product [Prorocentrum cordatum]|uniref:RRM domain-containing protein n=1 Tax=Prorocentrum cordatum TaxID=2364126 RepID=A0ABN9T4J1_9DINO|nr:unnamed protein product [Polarella glacialis]
MLAFNGFGDWPVPSTKICSVDLSRTQGIEQNIRLYRNSAVMRDGVPEWFRPVLFDGTDRVPFPLPTRELQQMPHQCDERTTVILRNLPCSFQREDLIKEMDSKGFARLYNFVYVPADFRTHASKGYAFVNLVSTEEVQRFMLAFNGFRDWPVPSTKICSVDLSRTQGIERNIRLHQNSAIMGDEVPERFRPALFDGAVRVAFPEPARELQLIENQCDQRNTGLEQRCHGRRGPRSVQASVFRWDTTNPSHRAQGRAA